MLTDLLLGLGDGLVQHEGEVLNLPFQEVVVQGEGPQGRLQTQQVQAYSCNPREEASANPNQSAQAPKYNPSRENPPRQSREEPHLTCQVLVDRLHLALRSDECLLDHPVLLLFQVLHLSLQLPLCTCHLSFIDEDLKGKNKATSTAGGWCDLVNSCRGTMGNLSF